MKSEKLKMKSELKVENWKLKNLAIVALKPSQVKNEKLKMKNEKWIESWKLKIEKPRYWRPQAKWKIKNEKWKMNWKLKIEKP